MKSGAAAKLHVSHHRVVEHFGRAFGESLRTATMLSRCGSVAGAEAEEDFAGVVNIHVGVQTMMYLVNIIWPMPQRPCMIL